MENELRTWLEQVGYRLLYGKTNDPDGGAGNLHYALFMQNIYIRASSRIPAPAMIGTNKEGKIVLFFHPKVAETLPLAAGVELLKHEVLHLIMGHIASWRREAIEQYSQQIVFLASDIVVNQYIDCDVMTAAGLPPVTHELFGLEPNQTTEWYCRKLAEMVRDGVLNLDQKSTLELYLDPNRGAGDSDMTLEELLEKLSDNPWNGPWEVIVHDEDVPDEIVEQKLVEAIERTKEESGAQRPNSQARGWDAADAKSLIEQVKRKPTLPWHALVRRMESRHRQDNKEPSLFKASRRGPTPPYLGRVRRSSLTVWFCVDTSGSMGPEQLRIVDPELKGIAQRGGNIVVFHADAGVAKREAYHPRRGLERFHGRGGTDFSPVLLELLNTPPDKKPNFLIYFTDGYGCLTAYKEEVIQRYGSSAWARIVGSRKSPDGVDMLWLLPEGSATPSEFKKRVASFGRREVVPLAKGKRKRG